MPALPEGRARLARWASTLLRAPAQVTATVVVAKAPLLTPCPPRLCADARADGDRRRGLGDGDGERQSVALIGQVHRRNGMPGAGIARLEPLLGPPLAPSSGAAALLVALTHLYYAAGRGADHLRAAEQAIEMVRAMPIPYAAARTLAESGRVLAERGERDADRARLEAARAIFRRLGARPYLERAEWVISSLH